MHTILIFFVCVVNLVNATAWRYEILQYFLCC